MIGWILTGWLAFGIINAKWFRKKSNVLQRINDIHWGFLVTFDILMAFLIFSPLYLLRIIDERLYTGETISSFTGRNIILGKIWAKILGKVIDTIFLVLVNQEDHCLKEADKSFCLK